MSNSLKIIPSNEIFFNYVPKKHLNTCIQLINITDQILAFKIRTNVPACYLVKPHTGFLQPNSTIEVSITMQPTDYNPQNADISHKFLINVVPLPPNTDPATLADTTRFQQISDAAPKSSIQSYKLKVGLKFEGGGMSTSTSIIDKSMDDSQRLMTADNRASTLRSSMTGDTSFQEARDDLGRGSLMQSFSMEGPGTGMASNRASVIKEQNVLSQFGQISSSTFNTDQPLKISVEMKKDTAKAEERKSENRSPTMKTFKELEKRIDESENHKRNLNLRDQEMTGKAEDQTRMLFDLSEENARLKSELGNLKSSTVKNRTSSRVGQIEAQNFQQWHILLALLVGLIAGKLLL